MRYTQPQSGPAQIDPAYGSTFAYNAAILSDVVGAACVLNGSPAKAITPDGIALRFDTSAKYIAVTRKSASVLGPFNFLYVFSQLGSVVNGGTVLAMPGSSGNNNKIDIYTLNTGAIRADVYNSAGAATSVDSATGAIVAGGRYALSLIFNGTTLQWIVNGNLSGSAVAFTGSRTAESMSFTIGGTAASAASANHDIKLAAFVGDRQSPLTRNPWQLFRSPQRVMAAAGGTSYNYTASGGFTLSGTASTVRGAVKTASGGVTLSGAATQSRGTVRSAAGGIQLAGTASIAKGKAITASGGLAISGAATILRGVARSAAGGLQLAGAASVTFFSAVQSRVVTPAGGIIFGGTAAVVRTCTRLVSGGITFRGTSAVEFFSILSTGASDWIGHIRRRGRR